MKQDFTVIFGEKKGRVYTIVWREKRCPLTLVVFSIKEYLPHGGIVS